METSLKTMNLRSFQLYRVYVASLNMSEADQSLWCWILNEYIQVQNRQEICRFVITSFKKRRIGTLGSFMPYLWNTEKCDDVIDVQNSCFAHKTSCLFAVTFSLTYQGTKKCDGVQNSCFLIKQIACLFVCFLTLSSRCTFARVVTMVTSLQCCSWDEG